MYGRSNRRKRDFYQYRGGMGRDHDPIYYGTSSTTDIQRGYYEYDGQYNSVPRYKWIGDYPVGSVIDYSVRTVDKAGDTVYNVRIRAPNGEIQQIRAVLPPGVRPSSLLSPGVSEPPGATPPEPYVESRAPRTTIVAPNTRTSVQLEAPYEHSAGQPNWLSNAWTTIRRYDSSRRALPDAPNERLPWSHPAIDSILSAGAMGFLIPPLSAALETALGFTAPAANAAVKAAMAAIVDGGSVQEATRAVAQALPDATRATIKDIIKTIFNHLPSQFSPLRKTLYKKTKRYLSLPRRRRPRQ